MIAAFIAGTLAGSLHVIAGPDHLAAVAPFAIRGRWRAWVAGAQWGIGHSVSVGLVALLAWWLRDALPLERISAWSEQIVGVVLVALGLWTLRSAFRGHAHIHDHEHDGTRHSHLHLHGSSDGHESRPAHDHTHGSLWMGVLHGLAGSSHLLGVLPALSFPSRTEAAWYLGGYGLGTIGAMVAFAMILGTVSARAGHRREAFYTGILAVAGAAAIVVGGVWLA